MSVVMRPSIRMYYLLMFVVPFVVVMFAVVEMFAVVMFAMDVVVWRDEAEHTDVLSIDVCGPV